MSELLDYFLQPKKTGYDFPKTLTYAIVLVIAVYLIYKLLKKIKIKIDKRLAVAIAPYILFGSTLRVLQDMGLVNSYFFITPGIYFFVFFIVLLSVAFSLVLEKKAKIPYFKTSFVMGLLMAAVALAYIKPVNFQGVPLIATYFLPWLILFGILLRRWSLPNRIVSSLHLLDATVTFVAIKYFSIDYGYYEQHIVPTILINMFGPASFILVKFVSIVAILLLIDRFSEDKEFAFYLKLCIGILGAATGIRDFISLLSLV